MDYFNCFQRAHQTLVFLGSTWRRSSVPRTPLADSAFIGSRTRHERFGGWGRLMGCRPHARRLHQGLRAQRREEASQARARPRYRARAQTTELDISDVLPRGREHKERRERLELAASEARTALESIADSDSGSWEQLEDACRELQAKA